jgi:hypothetical protein
MFSYNELNAILCAYILKYVSVILSSCICSEKTNNEEGKSCEEKATGVVSCDSKFLIF